MENLIGKLFDWDKIPMKLIFLLFIISAILLFTPEQYIQHLKLESFISEYGKFIGITFITSIGFLLVSLISYVIRIIRDKITNRKVKKAVIKNLQRLTNHEIFVLREFFINGKSTLQLPFLNETVVSLEK
ncbi:super-infection exclusion protein B [Chryseobacterium wanjuense]